MDIKVNGHRNDPLFGIPVHQSPCVPVVRPKFQLSPHLEYITPAFKNEYNVWLREWFGVEPAIYKTENSLVMHPSTYQYLRDKLKENTNGHASLD